MKGKKRKLSSQMGQEVQYFFFNNFIQHYGGFNIFTETCQNMRTQVGFFFFNHVRKLDL
jgi:hypothetical protein